MSLTCRRCKRTNPPEALYCYYDGVALDGAHARGPIATGSQPFPQPFVFPSDQRCGSFDELVLACEKDWDAAGAVIKQGYLENFLGGLGRVDLALAARVASASPDLDRGLDEFLGKLPSTVREPAQLVVEQRELDLGEMPSGTEQRFTLRVKNAGMGLLQGTVSCGETAWLAVGDAPAGPQKMFQCRGETSVPVHVVGKALRANAKPLSGKLVVESTGGAVEVMVRVLVPIKPFPEGVLAGAKTPRQVAERAKVSAREAAPLFASGAVSAWYASNGWTYPVQGPSATGLGAVQQFFEALGLVAAPKVTISTETVQFRGAPGAFLEQIIQVQTVEKRPVYAHAVSKSPWLQIGKVQLKGQTAHIPLLIPSVPSMPGEELQSRVEVAANGNQHFTVTVALAITEGAGRAGRMAAVVPPLLPMEATIGVRDLELVPERFFPPTLPPGPSPLLAVPSPPPLPASGPPPLAALPVAAMPVLPLPSSPFDFQNAVDVEPIAMPIPVGAVRPAQYDGGRSGGILKHLVPLLLLLLGLGCMLVHDYRLEDRDDPTTPDLPDVKAIPIDPEPYLALRFHDTQDKGVAPALARRLGGATMRFGLVMAREPIPNKPGKFKKLTFSEYGATNNTCVRIDGQEYLFGEIKRGETRWDRQAVPLPKDGDREPDGLVSVWEVEPGKGERLVVTQTAEIVAGAPLPGEKKRRLDTCLVHYEIKNEGEKEHQVGIRFLLDTFIGSTDGVPFMIPGRHDLCDTKESLDTPRSVPDFIQVLEKDLENPGTVARVQFRIGKQYEAPSRVFLGGYPDEAWGLYGKIPGAAGPLTRWDVPHLSMVRHEFKVGPMTNILDADSCVVMYWDEEPLKPRSTRKVGFAYGLGAVSSQESGGKLVLTVGGQMAVGSPFTLTALVQNPDAQGETLTLDVPTDLELKEGHEKETVPVVQPKAGQRVSTVTWRILAAKPGPYILTVKSSRGVHQTVAVQIRARGLFD